MQRDQLESHIEGATKSHLDLACGELRDTQKKLKEKIIHFDGLEETVNILHEQLEETINDIQHQHQNNVDLIQQQHQRRGNMLQDQLEQKVKTCQTKLEQKLSMERKMFLVCLVLGLVFLAYYLTKVEDRVQTNFEEKLIQILEERVHKHLEEKLTVIQSLHGSNAGMVRKDLEDEIQKKLDEKVSIIKNLEDRVKTKLEEKVSVIQSLHERIVILEMDPEVSHNFIWKITSFENQVKNTEYGYIESVPFYAYGYKLMLRLYPKRFDNGENTHLSIAIFVMKGEYDAILPWGFSKKVTFTLIEQQDNPDQRQDVVMGFTTDPNTKEFKKPVEGERRSGFGFAAFVSHSVLRTRRFIVDDTIFIKVQVAQKTSWF